MPTELDASDSSPGGRFQAACAEAVARLPLGLDAIVAPTLVGFVLLNGCTFVVDLLLLTLLHGGLRIPLPVALTAGYIGAFALSYVLNRVLNFRSHAAVASQAVVYVAAVVVNYAVFILGLSSGLSALGVQYHLARIVAGGCEAVFMYTAMRWLIFR